MPNGILTVTISTNMDMYQTNEEAMAYLLDQLGEAGATWSFEVAD